MTTEAKQAIGTILAILGITSLIIFYGYAMYLRGQTDEKRTNPVCHTIVDENGRTAEDADISDCDYRNGAWYRK